MNDNQFLGDNELVKKYLAGDEFAFETLVEHYQHRIYNFSLRIVQNPDDAADLTQEIFILVLRKIDTFRGESKFSTWLYSVACNTCKDFLRRKKPLLSLSDLPFLAEKSTAQKGQTFEFNDPANMLERKEIRNRVDKSITELPLKYRLVIVLHDIQSLSYNAETLGLSIGTVKSRLSRARFKLTKKLACFREQLKD